LSIDCSGQRLCGESHSFLCSVRQPRAAALVLAGGAVAAPRRRHKAQGVRLLRENRRPKRRRELRALTIGASIQNTFAGRFDSPPGAQFTTRKYPAMDAAILVPLLVPLCTSILCISWQLCATSALELNTVDKRVMRHYSPLCNPVQITQNRT
jgi:hypothetical protein